MAFLQRAPFDREEHRSRQSSVVSRESREQGKGQPRMSGREVCHRSTPDSYIILYIILSPLANRLFHMLQMTLIIPTAQTCLLLAPAELGSGQRSRGFLRCADILNSPGSLVDPMLFFARPWHCQACNSRRREVLSPSWLPRSSCLLPTAKKEK